MDKNPDKTCLFCLFCFNSVLNGSNLAVRWFVLNYFWVINFLFPLSQQHTLYINIYKGDVPSFIVSFFFVLICFERRVFSSDPPLVLSVTNTMSGYRWSGKIRRLSVCVHLQLGPVDIYIASYLVWPGDVLGMMNRSHGERLRKPTWPTYHVWAFKEISGARFTFLKLVSVDGRPLQRATGSGSGWSD